MMQSIRSLKNTHPDSTIVVVAPGKSIDYLDQGFFHGRLVVGVDTAYLHVRCDYLVTHRLGLGQDVIDQGVSLVCSECEEGDHTLPPRPLYQGDYFTYGHGENLGTRGIDLAALDTDAHLAISACSAAEAVHFAAYLGAETILLCGFDGGRLDGRMSCGGEDEPNPAAIPLCEPLMLQLVRVLRERGVQVYSINPFINPGMEGHLYSRPPVGTVYVGSAITDHGGKSQMGLSTVSS